MVLLRIFLALLRMRNTAAIDVRCGGGGASAGVQGGVVSSGVPCRTKRREALAGWRVCQTLTARRAPRGEGVAGRGGCLELIVSAVSEACARQAAAGGSGSGRNSSGRIGGAQQKRPQLAGTLDRRNHLN